MQTLKAIAAFIVVMILLAWAFWVLPEAYNTPSRQQIFLAGTMAQWDHATRGGKNPLLFTDQEIDSLAFTVRVK